MSARAFRVAMTVLLVAGLAVRVAYVAAQPSHDPGWNRPVLDGAFYFEWARALAGEGTPPGGAFYLAPLYPYLLAAFLKLFGANFVLLFLVQETALVAAAALLAAVAYRRAGKAGALATAAFVLLYHPAMFFAARPVGESLALVLLAAALAAFDRPGYTSDLAGGALAALGALARPNLLLVPLAWIAADGFARRWLHALIVAAAVAAVLLPVAARNAAVSGHWTPISSNGGITLHHGNGPGATGVFTPPRGLSGRLDTQREEATALARLRSGKDLDPVEADAWWGGQAIRARVDDPIGSLSLVAWRLLLFFDNYEHGLDYAPALDRNPWRFAAPLPLAALFGLAVAGLVVVGFRGTGGVATWGAFAACAAAPIVFYAASRYRLPAAVVLCVPAGAGFAALIDPGAWRASPLRSALGALCGAAVVAGSLLVPSGELARSSEAGALANLADVLYRTGDAAGAEAAAREGISRDPQAAPPRFQLGVLLEKQGRAAEAERVYHDALQRDPGHAGAAANLARLLVERSEPAGAVAVLREALRANPTDALCWNNLVVALALMGRRAEAVASWQEAKDRGVAVDPNLLGAIGGAEKER